MVQVVELIQSLAIPILIGDNPFCEIEFRLNQKATPNNVDIYIADKFVGSVALANLKELCKKILELFEEA